MARVKRGIISRGKREQLVKYTKGFRWSRKSKERAAKEALLHAWSRAFKGRKEKKREYRSLWNIRLNAALRKEGLKYSGFINLLKKKNVKINRKILAELAVKNPEAFKKIVDFTNVR